jgi:hypothetical protein
MTVIRQKIAAQKDDISDSEHQSSGDQPPMLNLEKEAIENFTHGEFLKKLLR